MDHIKLGVCEHCLPSTGPEVCRIASEKGLQGVALEIGNIKTGLHLTETQNQKRYLDAAQRHSIEFSTLALNTFDSYTLLHPEYYAEAQVVWDTLRRSVSTAVAMRIPVIQVPSFFNNGIKSKKDLLATAVYLRKMCELAEPLGIIIGSENTLGIEENLELIDTVKRPNFKLFFDNQNAVFFRGDDPANILKCLGIDRICQIHIKDGSKDSLGTKRLGEGNGHIRECLDVICQINYQGWVILENHYEDPVIATLDDLSWDVKQLKNLMSSWT